jgi:hypothetical protein
MERERHRYQVDRDECAFKCGGFLGFFLLRDDVGSGFCDGIF